LGEKIVGVGGDGGRQDCPVVDLGNAAILPGLVNAHTHLELSDLASPLGEPGESMALWLRRVVEYRERPGRDPELAVASGLTECVRHGTTSVGEIALPNWTTAPFDRAPIDAIVFLELIGLAPSAIEARLDSAANHLRRGTAGADHWRTGLSPHAPYTVHPSLLSAIIEVAGPNLVAMHVAESAEELYWLRTGGGPLGEFLIERGVWQRDSPPRNATPLDTLQRLVTAQRSLVIHGNFLTDAEIEVVARNADRMSLVYCPRTHAFFGHPRHPLVQLIKAGAHVAIGTDSRASNPDLSLLAELRHVAREFAELPLNVVLELGTIRGAHALGQANLAGGISPGKLANLAVVELPDDADPSDPHELLLHHDGRVLATVYRGDVVFDGGGRFAAAG
jgi:cytosine/adenosine deaminase-related metal-dependent hydrolase